MAAAADVRRYTTSASAGDITHALQAAGHWVRRRTYVDWWPHPPAVVEATALLAALFLEDPDVLSDDSKVPAMIHVMLIPWRR